MNHDPFMQCSQCDARVSGLTKGGRVVSWRFRGILPPGWGGTMSKPLCTSCHVALIDSHKLHMRQRSAASAALRAKVRELFGDVGCYDGGCIYGKTGGMQTNGGCGCVEKNGSVHDAITAARRVREAAIAIIAEHEALR
jgi:hypothetical protein